MLRTLPHHGELRVLDILPFVLGQHHRLLLAQDQEGAGGTSLLQRRLSLWLRRLCLPPAATLPTTTQWCGGLEVRSPLLR